MDLKINFENEIDDIFCKINKKIFKQNVLLFQVMNPSIHGDYS